MRILQSSPLRSILEASAPRGELIPGLLPADGIAILTAAPKVGKTMFASQAALATSAEALDATVERSLRSMERKVSSRRAKKALKELIRSHTARRRTFLEKLASLPGHSTRCA